MDSNNPSHLPQNTDSLRLYQDLEETSQDLIWQCDANGLYTYLNPAWETVFGYTINEMLGHRFSDFQSPEFALRDQQEFARLLAGGIATGYETVHLSKSGTEIHLVFSAKFVRDQSDAVIGIRGTAHDITVRRHIERSLEQSSAIHRSIIDSSPMGMHQYELRADNQLVFVGANPAANKILGVDHSVFIGKTIEEAFPPLATSEIPDRYREVVRTGIQWQTEQIDYDDKKIRGAFHVVAFRIAPNCMVAMFLDITETKRAAAALLEQEARFGRILDIAVDAILIGSPSGMMIFANQQASRLTGYSRDELIEKSISMLFSEEEQKRVPLRYDLLKLGLAVRSERFLTRKGGFKVPVEMNTKMMPDGTYQAFIRDMTERRAIEKTLRLSEEKFSKAFKTSPDAININRLSDGVYIEINDGFTSTMGYTEADIIGRSSLPGDIGIWARASDRETMVADLTAHKEVIGLEAHFRRKDGKVITGLMSARIVELNGEKCILSITRDISGRKKMEEDLLAEKERLAVTLASIGDGVITTDTNGNVDIINEVGEKLTGWTQAEAKGKALTEVFNIINEISRQTCDNPVERVLLTGETVELANHTALVSRDGTERIIADSGAPIRNKNGDILGVVLVFRDMTEKQKLIDNAQQSQKLESLGIMAGGIAHDFNNLLSGIFGNIEMANISSSDKQVCDYLATASSTINRARGLTQQLLTFAKGGMPIQKPGHLFPFVSEAVGFALSGSNVLSRFNIAPDLRTCSFDKNQIGQVIDNIVINANQAMPRGGTISVTAHNVSLNIREHPILPAGEYVKITIADTGIGIPREIISHIFDPFFTTKSKGHGLGLATCYSIVNRHRGHIEVESRPGVGSLFSVYLPATTDSVSGSTDAMNNSIAKSVSGGTILVMDDEEVLRRAYSAILEMLGYTPVCMANGKDTLDFFINEFAAGRPIAAVILDLTIPGGMGGKEIAAEIRERNSQIPVFVASGYADDPVMAHPAQFGVTASLAKPFTVVDLSDMLKRYL